MGGPTKGVTWGPIVNAIRARVSVGGPLRPSERRTDRGAVLARGPGEVRSLAGALSRNSRYLYSLNSGDETISGFRVRANGGLTPIGGLTGLPDGADGLVAQLNAGVGTTTSPPTCGLVVLPALVIAV
jgi:hypothetical protein